MNAANPTAKDYVLLKQKVSSQDEQIQNQKQRIQILEEMLRQSRHKQFGASSEVSPQQGLFNEAEEEVESDAIEESVTVPTHTRKKQKRASIPDNIEREEIIHDLPESEKTCPHDGTTLKCIGEETHEQLDIIPAKIKALRHIRKKYACPCCEQYLVTAKKPK